MSPIRLRYESRVSLTLRISPKYGPRIPVNLSPIPVWVMTLFMTLDLLINAVDVSEAQGVRDDHISHKRLATIKPKMDVELQSLRYSSHLKAKLI